MFGLSITIVVLLIAIFYLYKQNRTLQKRLEDFMSRKEGLKVDLRNQDEFEPDYEEQDIFKGEEGESEEKPQEIETPSYPPIQTKVSKNEAIQIVNASLNRRELSNANTNFASINKAKAVWWFDINNSRFLNDLHLILAKEKGFIWLKIPKGTVKNPARTFYIRADNRLVQLIISAERRGDYLRDVSSGPGNFNFRAYVQKEF